MRIAVLWRPMQPGHNAAFRALAALPETRLFFCLPRPAGHFAADISLYGWMTDPYFYDWFSAPPGRLQQYLSSAGLDESLLQRRLADFAPDLLLANSWHVPAYRRVMRRYRHRPRVMRIDNQWTGSARQRLAAMAARCYLHPLFDAVLVDGTRQAVFARRMGYPEARIWDCGHSADHEAFAAIHLARQARGAPPGEAFLYVGRLVPEKGVTDLLQAYRRYRAEAKNPWPLIVCGRGPLGSQVEREPGVDWRGFVQPRDLPEVYQEAGCLVLPSRRERWGDVIHEAASAGLPVITTDRAGAADRLVDDRRSGFLVAPGDVDGLAERMLRLAALDVDARRVMGSRGFDLAQQLTPEAWATALRQRFEQILGEWPRQDQGASDT